MCDCIAEEAWQLNRSNDTTAKNLESYWEVLTALVKEFGWSKDEDDPRASIEKK